MVVDEDDEEEDEEEDEDELVDDEEEEEEDEVDVVLEEEVEEVVDDGTLEVVEELGVVVDKVEDGVWLVETVCDWVVVLFDEAELSTRYPPTATTRTTTTITPTTALLNALRRSRANMGMRPDVRLLLPIFLEAPHDLDVYMTSHHRGTQGETRKHSPLALLSKATGLVGRSAEQHLFRTSTRIAAWRFRNSFDRDL